MLNLHFFKNASQQLIDLIFPSVCGYCKEIISAKKSLCQSCLALIVPIISAPLVITKTKMLSVFAVSDYEYPLRALVQAKNQKNPVAADQLGHLLWDYTSLSYAEFDVIVPIALHWKKLSARWFNQSEHIAQVISNKSGKPVVHLLKRTKQTAVQAGLSRTDRQQNMSHVFSLTQQATAFKGLRILIVDDVMTTGATLQSACKALLPLKPAALLAAVACRVINK